MPDLSIIIVNYNVKEFILNLLDSIDKCSPEISREVIVVDNNSDDGSVEAIQKLRPDVKLIANKNNVGFGKANNQGLEICKGKFILLLNPDTIVKEDTFRLLIEKFSSTPDLGMAGCKVLNPDGTLQLACRRSFPGPWTSFTKVTGLSRFFPKSKLFARYNLTFKDENESYEVDAISGCFMFIKREVYEKIGGFDPVFFMYGEDLDLCYRVQQAGFKVYYFHDTEIIHYKGESTKRSSIDETKVFYNAMNLFVKKHLSSSLLVSLILQLAIFARKILAFLNVYRLILISVFVDFVIMFFALMLAENLWNKPGWNGFPAEVKPIVYFVPAFLQTLVSSLSGVYKKNSMSILKSLISLTLGFLLLTSLTFFFKQYAFSRFVALLTYVIAGFSFISWRIIFKLIFKVGLTFSSDKKKALIVGTNENGLNIAVKLKNSLHHLYQVTGFIDETTKSIGEEIGEFEVIGSIENIHKVVDENQIEKVIFSAGQLSFDKMFTIVSKLQGRNIEFQVAGSNQDFLVGKSNVTMLENIPLLDLNYNISKPAHKITKRFFDLSLAAGLMILFPFIWLVAKLFWNNTGLLKMIKNIPAVFTGKKSFVGPEVKENSNGLFLGKSGVTGMWFLDHQESNESEKEKLDIYYAKNQNIWLDMEILGRTISQFVFRNNK
ncbi:MAG: glycosyltransferase [Rhodothermaceae bacterium]